MFFEIAKLYRARTASGQEIVFTVTGTGDQSWITADLDENGTIEPAVWLNTSQLLWVSSEAKRKLAITKAADEVIEALENTMNG